MALLWVLFENMKVDGLKSVSKERRWEGERQSIWRAGGSESLPTFKRKSNTFFVLIWTPSVGHEDNVWPFLAIGPFIPNDLQILYVYYHQEHSLWDESRQLFNYATAAPCNRPGLIAPKKQTFRSRLLQKWKLYTAFLRGDCQLLLAHIPEFHVGFHPSYFGVCSGTEVAPSWGPPAFHMWNLLWPFASRQYFWSNPQNKQHMPCKIIEGGKVKLKNWILHLILEVLRPVVMLSALWVNLHRLWQWLRNFYERNV